MRRNIFMLLIPLWFACEEGDKGLEVKLTVAVWPRYNPSTANTGNYSPTLEDDADRAFLNTNKLFCNQLEEDSRTKCSDDVTCPITVSRKSIVELLPATVDKRGFDGIVDKRVADELLRWRRERQKYAAYANVMVIKYIDESYYYEDSDSNNEGAAGFTKPQYGGMFISQDYFHKPRNVLAHEIGHLLMNYGLASIDYFKDGAHLTCKAEIYVSGQKHKINEKYFLTGCGEKKGVPNDYYLFQPVCDWMLDPDDDVITKIKIAGGEENEVDVSELGGCFIYEDASVCM